MSYAAVFVGGGLGAVARYALQGLVYRSVQGSFPYGTMAVNIIGCFIIGFLMIAFEERFMVNPLLRLFVTVGILGGFTTFSSFSFETFALLRDGEIMLGVVNAGASLIGCLAATYIGAVAGKLI